MVIRGVALERLHDEGGDCGGHCVRRVWPEKYSIIHQPPCSGTFMRPSCVGARCGQRSRTKSAAGAFAVASSRRKLQHTLHARAYCCRIPEKLVAQLKRLLAVSELLEKGIARTAETTHDRRALLRNEVLQRGLHLAALDELFRQLRVPATMLPCAATAAIGTHLRRTDVAQR